MTDALRAFQTVYSYPTPEVQQIVESLVNEYPSDLIDEGWIRSTELLGYQVAIFDDLINLREKEVEGLSGYQYRYPTYGSDHAICEYLTYLSVEEGVSSIYVLENDYEGYVERALSRGIKPHAVAEEKTSTVEPGIWFISNPSARDGNLLQDRVIYKLLEAGHRVVYDLAYLGTTDEIKYDLRHGNIDGALISFSKPYGLFSHRIGFSFFRRPVPSLEANALWFKNIFGLTLASKILKGLYHDQYAARYKRLQRSIVRTLAERTDLPLKASDAFLLAHVTPDDASELSEKQRDQLMPYKRGDRYRLCLTPYFMEARE